MNRFATWLAQTPPSQMLQTYEWMVPAIQSAHLVTMSVVLGAVFMLVLRACGLAWRDQSMAHTYDRFGPWLWWGLVVLLVTGVGMVVGEPARQLLALSFWLKMALLAALTGLASAWARRLRLRGLGWDPAVRPGARVVAAFTLLLWWAVVVLGRLIAYDYVWGSWSKALKG